ncbi:MAG: type I DNA topoisomerase [Rikenellaceae bacterium]
MADNLVIVESPAKAKTIEKILGENFVVKSSFGHVRDLPKKDIGVDVNNSFTPNYEVSADKQKVVSELKSLAKKSKCVWLASDEDREGEAIAWHLSEVLSLDKDSTKRIVFHEITKNAILNAIENPRTIDTNLVDAQQARRILDRLVGFELSPILWKKVKPGLSAGRVQSVAVRLIVQREKEIIDFKAGSSFRVVALCNLVDDKGKTQTVKAELNKKFKTEQEAYNFLEMCKDSEFTISNATKKPGKRTPAAPFTTSTLQQEASRKLGFSVSQTMTVAQRLYESGLITYMRTDSVNLSQEAISGISKVIVNNYSEKYLHNRVYKTKSKGAQEAHEAIRPTYFDKNKIEGASAEKRLYELIWKRAVASQMADAQLEKTVIDISISKSSEKFVVKGEVIVFDGFLSLYQESSDNEDEQNSDSTRLPKVNVGDNVTMASITATQRFDQRPPRYTEASLVKHLEELGIGRPSTYAPTISTVINRGYVVKEDREGVRRDYLQLELLNNNISKLELSETTGAERAKLFPTDTGMLVNDYLEKNFAEIINYNFTATVEEQFDYIAEGSIKMDRMLNQFYADFHKTIETAASKEADYANSQRDLGVDPVSGKPVVARMGRYGAIAQIGDSGDENDKPRFASLRSDQLIANITLEEALKLFDLPRDLGNYEDKKVSAAIGRFGPYIRHDNKFVSLPKDDSPYSVDLERAIELIEAKRKSDREKVLRVFAEDGEMQILNGRWGPYIAYDGANFKIPKGSDIEAMTYEQYKSIVDESIKNGDVKPKRGAKKATTTKKTATKKATTVKKTAAKTTKKTVTKDETVKPKAKTTRAKKTID